MIAEPAARNDPCPCGSGKRYKHCHGARGEVPPPPLPPAPTPPPPVAQVPAEALPIAAARATALAVTEQNPAAAESAWRALLTIAPGDPEASFHLGNMARERDDYDAAIAHFIAGLERAPGHYGLSNNLGLAYRSAGRLADAEDAFRLALAANPDGLEPLANLAQNLYQQLRYLDSLTYFEPLVRRYPDIAQAAIHANRGVALSMCGRLPEAEAALKRALELEPTLPSLQRDMGYLLIKQKRWTAASEVLERVARDHPGDMTGGSLLEAVRSNLVDWRDGGDLRRRMREAIRDGSLAPGDAVTPFDFMAFCDDPELQRRAVECWVTDRIKPTAPPPRSLAPGEPLRLGFVSSDFGNHPVGRLLLGLLDHLDRDRFAAYAYVTHKVGRVDRYLDRVKAAVRKFVPIDRLVPDDAADVVRADRIDILFDLNGLTGTPATALFARRPAPLQVNFLGYTGTMAVAAYDYIVADRHCLPAAELQHYAERPLFVEPCYLPSDPARDFEAESPPRAHYGLPENGFVFAAFVAPPKISPVVFDCWMRLLHRHPDSVLWLRQVEERAVANLRAETARRGVDPTRVVFAATEPIPRYIGRLRNADLFLDSFPFGSHTTVNDALFAGLPVLTREGRSFASRASASQLLAAGLPELVARNEDEYEAIANALVEDRARLRALTARLRDAKATAPLFDMKAYARSFEAALLDAWASVQRKPALTRD